MRFRLNEKKLDDLWDDFIAKKEDSKDDSECCDQQNPNVASNTGSVANNTASVASNIRSSKTTAKNITKNTSSSPPNGGNGKNGGISPMKDDVANEYQELLTEHVPSAAWGSIPQERKQLKNLADRTRRLNGVTGLGLSQLPRAMLHTFMELRQREKASYWTNAPVTPSGLVARWDAIVATLAERENKRQREEEAAQRRRKFLYGTAS